VLLRHGANMGVKNCYIYRIKINLMLFQEIIKVLLRHGANMGVKNWDERPPVNRILPATLQATVFTHRERKITRKGQN
jgi:hypothetical protein